MIKLTIICLSAVVCVYPSVSFSQSIQDMGNTKARQLYEANLPESFRRPQTDQYPSLAADQSVKEFKRATVCSLELIIFAYLAPYSPLTLT